MQVARLVVLAAGATLVWGCASTTQRLPVQSASGNLAALAGEWRGEYTSPENGRTGTIYFLLQTGENSAAGDVVMLAGRGARVVDWEDRVTMASARFLAEVLTVSFVSFDNGMVSGRMGPYRDSDCGHMHVTTFFGEVQDNRISGRFISRSDAHEPHVGEWIANRVN